MVAAARERLVRTLRHHDRLHRAARGLRFVLGRFIPPRQVAGVPGRIHFNDFMFLNKSPEEVVSYAERARNVVSLIDEALDAAGLTSDEIETWLDFGCGYGRVVRFLAARVPPERIFVSDVSEEGVQFCVSEFGVQAVPSAPDLTTVRLGSYDFIYAISVITHLNERNSLAFLRLLGESLNPGGIVLFTTHGEWSVENPGHYGQEYESRRDEIVDGISKHGFAYVPYSFVADDYGMTWHSRTYIETKIAELHAGEVVPLLFKPHGLDGHQDVYAFRRIGASDSRTA